MDDEVVAELTEEFLPFCARGDVEADMLVRVDSKSGLAIPVTKKEVVSEPWLGLVKSVADGVAIVQTKGTILDFKRIKFPL